MTIRNMTTIIACLLALALTLTPTLAAAAKTEKAESAAPEQGQANHKDKGESAGLTPVEFSKGFFSVGTIYSDLKDSQLGVSEYSPALQGFRPTGRIGLWGYKNGFAYDLFGELGADATDQKYDIAIDANRYWKSELSISKLPHRLVNDPLTNLDTGKGPVIVTHEDLDKGIQYCPAYQNTEWRNRVRLPFLPLVTLHLDYRNQLRKGSYDGRTMSKCANCHVVSDVRAMDRETEEIRAGFDIGNSKAKFEYEYLNRELRERSETPTLVYDEVRHPALLARVFTNRTQFDSHDGALPYNEIPNFTKDRHLLRGRVSIPNGGGEVVGTFLTDRLENKGAGYGIDTQVASGYYATKIGKNFRFTMKARNLEVDSDRIFVDVVETVADGGPQKGKTFFEAYPAYGEPDFWQTSALERDTFDFKVDARWLLPGKSVFRGGYEFEKLERPNYEVDQTKTNRIKLAFNTAPSKTFKARVRYLLAHSDKPLVHVHAALPPALQPYPTPGLSPFAGTQYFTIYRARETDLSNQPKDVHEFVGSATWSPTDRFALSTHLRAKAASNDELNSYGNWSDKDISPSVELWFAPDERVDLLASYTLHHRRTETVFGVAVYDG